MTARAGPCSSEAARSSALDGATSTAHRNTFLIPVASGRRSLRYADKPFLYRLHSREAFGDGGLVMAMLWGLTLLVLTVTGLIIYSPGSAILNRRGGTSVGPPSNPSPASVVGQKPL
jgi:hypothetical protein